MCFPLDFRIVARGARGGKGADGMGISKGATAVVVVELYKGQTLHILVGQEGGDACRKVRTPPTYHHQKVDCREFFRSWRPLRETNI